jgi:hypothetical protein
VFEGLLDEPHNKRVLKLLYRTAEWHVLGKLRMHTDATLKHLELLTKEFGLLMRQFRDITCRSFETVELPCKCTARNRQCQHDQTNTLNLNTGSMSSSQKPKKKINLSTPKFHFLGDYVQNIRLFGCTDSFSTQVVCANPFFLELISDDNR